MSELEPLCIKVTEAVTLEVGPYDGVSVNGDWYDSIPIKELDIVADFMKKVKKDVEEGKINFEPSPILLQTRWSISSPSNKPTAIARDCPICGEKPIIKDNLMHVWDMSLCSYKDMPCGELYKMGIPWEWREFFDVVCPRCHYILNKVIKVDKEDSDEDRLEACSQLIERWNTQEPSEDARKRAEWHLEYERICQEAERKRKEAMEREKAEFNARRDDVKRMLGWLDD